MENNQSPKEEYIKGLERYSRFFLAPLGYLQGKYLNATKKSIQEKIFQNEEDFII